MPSIRAPEDAPDVVVAIKHLFSTRQFTDFYFLSRDGREQYHVHKLIVAIQSPVLAKRLYPAQMDSNNRPKAPEFEQVKYSNSLALQNLISFLYDDDLVLENISDIRQTKVLAEKYEVHGLNQICKEQLINIPISTNDVLSILESAKEFQNEQKENDCLRLISENQKKIFTSRQFLGLPFRRVLNIFEKIKELKRMSEASFLHSAIRWLDTNAKTSGKELLMEKIDVTSFLLDDYLDIIEEFPNFFTNIEISYTIKEIRLRNKTPKTKKEPEIINHKKECDVSQKNAEKNNKENLLLADVNFFKQELLSEIEKREDLQRKYNTLVVDFESKNVEIKLKTQQMNELEGTMKKLRARSETVSPMSSLPLDSKQKHLSIQILNQEDGVNVFELEKRARITVQAGNTIRSIQVAVNDVLRKGLIGTVVEKKGNYSESDVDINYEGLYFMLRSLKQLDETLSPNQYIEVLKAALYFQLKDVAEQCIKRISGIIDYDPVFLDGLRTLSYLKDKCLGLKGFSEFKDKYTALLLSEPLRVILHPNFTECSVDLIVLLLQQSELKVKDESQLLLVVIAWLEAHKEARKIFRMTLLKNLAFENLSTSDFRYSVMHYPKFFDEKEQKLILAYRNAVGSEVKFFRENLPEWYSTKTRKHI